MFQKKCCGQNASLSLMSFTDHQPKNSPKGHMEYEGTSDNFSSRSSESFRVPRAGRTVVEDYMVLHTSGDSSDLVNVR